MELGTIVAWIALFLTVGQLSYSIYKGRRKFNLVLLHDVFIKDKVILKIVVTNHSSNGLVIDHFELHYNDPNVLVQYAVNGTNYKITESIKSTVLPLNIAPYQSQMIFLVLTKQTLLDHKWILHDDSRYEFYIYTNGRSRPTSKTMPITRKLISLERLRTLETDLIDHVS